LKRFDRLYVLADLLEEALNNRVDLAVALQQTSISQRTLQLAKANRALDLGVTLGVDYLSYVRNVIAPTPSMATIKVGISIPLKFSNNKPGEWRAAQYHLRQAEQEYKQVELEIQTEVAQAYYIYLANQKQIKQFDMGLLADSKSVLEGKIYSYQRGETSLLEVLNAQRTYNEVQQNYYQTQYKYAIALVELQRAAGIWDINF